MKLNKFGLILTTLAFSTIGFDSGSSAWAASFFGEDIQHFKNGEVKDAPDLSILQNSNTAELEFLSAIGSSADASGIATVNFEAEEGFTELGKTGDEFFYKVSREKADGSIFNITISDPNKGDIALHTSIEKTAGNVTGGRYGISEANKTMEERLSNQFLNTNAGKDSKLKFSFSEATSAFGFYGTDFERGGVMAIEFTRVTGTKEYISLRLSNPEDFDKTIRGTAFYFGHIAESEDEYFTEVRFDISDAAKGTNDMVAFDRMTFASPALKQEVPEPGIGLLALGGVLSGVALKRRKSS
ncbi:MAG: hypothetical protein AAF915_25360 [Cyanobacteria bacterium P01_D01_bin.50]